MKTHTLTRVTFRTINDPTTYILSPDNFQILETVIMLWFNTMKNDI